MPRHCKIIKDLSKSYFRIAVGSRKLLFWVSASFPKLRTPVSAARAPVDGARALGGAAGIGAAKR